jgi:hypothetical protein
MLNIYDIRTKAERDEELKMIRYGAEYTVNPIKVKEYTKMVEQITREKLEELFKQYSGVTDHAFMSVEKRKRVYLFMDDARYVTDLLSGLEPIEKAIKKIHPLMQIHIESR